MAIRYVHTNIIAADWRQLAQFYEEVLGCAPVPPPRDQAGPWLDRGAGLRGARLRGVHLRLPGHGDSGPTLEIYSYDRIEPCPPGAANRRGLGHLAFEVADVNAVLRAIITHGGAALGQISEHDVPARDPEGNILEIQRWSHEPAAHEDLW